MQPSDILFIDLQPKKNKPQQSHCNSDQCATVASMKFFKNKLQSRKAFTAV